MLTGTSGCIWQIEHMCLYVGPYCGQLDNQANINFRAEKSTISIVPKFKYYVEYEQTLDASSSKAVI